MNGWHLSLSALRGLTIDLLQDNGLSYLSLRKINQDHVENLHCQIRSYHGFNDHPMCDAYATALRCLSASFAPKELILSKSANCESSALDDAPLSNVIPVPSCVQPVPACLPNAPDQCAPLPNQCAPLPNQCAPELPFENVEDDLDTLSEVERNVVAYISGSVVNTVRKKLSCDECSNSLSINESYGCHVFTTLKEYTPGCLVRVSPNVQQLLESFESHFRRQTSVCLPRPHPRESIISSFISNVSLTACPGHSLDLKSSTVKPR